MGIVPTSASGMIMQLLADANLIEIDFSWKGDGVLFSAAQKHELSHIFNARANFHPLLPHDVFLTPTFIPVFEMMMAFGQSTAYVLTGLYDPPSSLGPGVCLLIIKLIAAALLIILLNELLHKGYGLGSDISLFIVTNNCESIVWKAFSPITVNISCGLKFERAVIALFHLLVTLNNKARALREAFWQEH